MADLFDSPSQSGDMPEGPAHRPLADVLRPASLSEVIGQQQVLGPEGSLRVMLDAGALGSIIFWGPPGVGKTTIARLLAQETDLHFVQISAIFTGVPDLRKVFEAAKQRRKIGQGTLLFVDEIHRFNKAQQETIDRNELKSTLVSCSSRKMFSSWDEMEMVKVTWKRYATGFDQPMGVHIDEDGVFVLDRGRITRLHDLSLDPHPLSPGDHLQQGGSQRSLGPQGKDVFCPSRPAGL